MGIKKDTISSIFIVSFFPFCLNVFEVGFGEELFSKSSSPIFSQHPNSSAVGEHIRSALVLGKELRKLDKTASRTCACCRIVVYGLGGSAEVYSREPIVTAACDKVVSNLLCSVEVSLFACMDIGKDEAVKTPSLSA